MTTPDNDLTRAAVTIRKTIAQLPNILKALDKIPAELDLVAYDAQINSLVQHRILNANKLKGQPAKQGIRSSVTKTTPKLPTA